MTSYVWALISNREFSLDIRHPCPLTQLFEPNEVFWNKSIKCYDNSDEETEKLSSVLVNKIDKFDYLNEFKLIDLTEYFSNIKIILLRANLDYIQPLSENKVIEQKILSLGLVDKIENFKMAHIFRPVYNKLFKLTPKLQKVFDRFKTSSKQNPNAKLICAQIRIGANRPEEVCDRIFTERKDSKLFWDFIREEIIQNDNNFKIFITSDTESVVNEALDEFGEDKIMNIDGFYNHIDVGPVSNSTCKLYEKTILDFHAFQQCDKVVVSRGGYGLMANFLRKNPFQDFFRYTEIIADDSKNSTQVKIKKFVQIRSSDELEKNIKIEINWIKNISTKGCSEKKSNKN